MLAPETPESLESVAPTERGAALADPPPRAIDRPPRSADRLPRYGDELEVRIDALDDKGLGLGRLSQPVRLDGEEVIVRARVRGGLPGALVRATALKRRRRVVEARLEEVLEPSPDAVAAPCPHFGPCGGCTFQHLAYDAQLALKRARVARALVDVGLVPAEAVAPVLGMDDPWHYRNKLDFTFGARRWRTLDEAPDRDASFALGLHVPGLWSKVLDVETCSIAFEGADALRNSARRLAVLHGLEPWDTKSHTGLLRHVVLRRGVRTGETMLVLVTSERAAERVDPFAAELLATHPELTTLVQDVTARHSMVAIGEEQFVLHGPGTIDERLAGRTFTLSPHSFFQTNTLQAERMLEVVREESGLAQHRDAGGDVGGGLVYDLYSGAGTIGLCLADLARELVGFESVGAAVRDARANAARNDLAGATFVEGDVLESLLARAADGPPRPDLVILDPPRVGLHPKVAPSVLALEAARIVYVSCNPESAARDLTALVAGGYALERVRPIDLFPHTPHIETVLSLRRVAEGGPR